VICGVLGENTPKKEGELVLSLCSLSKGAASFLTHTCQKTKKRDEKGKKETKEAKKRDHFDRVTRLL